MAAREAKLVSTGEAASTIGVNPTTLQRWVSDGQVRPAVRTPGGHYRWDLAELRRQIEDLYAVITAVVVSPEGVLVVQHEGEKTRLVTGRRAGPGESFGDAAGRLVLEQTGLAVDAAGELGRRSDPASNQTVRYVACVPAADSTSRPRPPATGVRTTWVALAEAAGMVPSELHEPLRQLQHRRAP